MPTHQLISPTRCTRSHETSRNELNLTGPSRNPANIIYETKPIPSHQHRRPLTPNTRQHEIPNEPNFARNRLQTKPIRLPRRTQFHPNPTAMPPRHRQALLPTCYTGISHAQSPSRAFPHWFPAHRQRSAGPRNRPAPHLAGHRKVENVMNPSNPSAPPSPAPGPSNFVRDIILEDLKTNKYQGRVHTRFPPEPNGYLHIGHAKSICLNFGLAAEFGGKTNLRFDDTNPEKEETEYVDSIMDNVKWLGFDWEDRLYYASDYFGQLYQWAVDLIRKGNAYVCDLTADQVRQYRGNLTEAGKPSPYRDRSTNENLDLFERMKNGEFPDGSRTLRAKIDMASPNLNMRDPVTYRILHADHHRTGSTWCIYPMYDFAHGEPDSSKKSTPSICTLEFEDHRPLYDSRVQME